MYMLQICFDLQNIHTANICSKLMCGMLQDAHESLLKILHNLTKIDLFPGLAFSQESTKYSSIIVNTFSMVLKYIS